MSNKPGLPHRESDLETLRLAARDACANAHSIYSNFPVGSALLAQGEVFIGCNVENASYGLTICAERNALAQAVANGVAPGEIQALLIYTPGAVAHSPCGACRQFMHELLNEETVIVSCCDGDDRKTWRMAQLLPDPFKF